MRRRYDHRHAGLADLHAAQTVNHRDAADRMRARDLAPDLGHHLHRHRLVAFIIQELGAAAFGVVPHHAFEVHHRAIFAPQQLLRDSGGVDRLARQREEITLLGVDNLLRIASGPAAHGRQKRDLVAISNNGRPVAELMIASQYDARFELAQPWKLAGVALEDAAEAGARFYFDLLFRAAHNIPQHAEK